MDYFDPCIENPSEETLQKAKEVGWKDPSKYDTAVLDEQDWGQLKKKIQRTRDQNHVIAVRGGDEKINRRSASDPRVDILLHPGKGRKDSGLDKGIAESAAENNVALGLDFSRTRKNTKEKVHLFTEWRKNLKLCEKYGMVYIITTAAIEPYDLRAPRDLQSLINSIGFSGSEAMIEQKNIIEKNTEKLKNETPGGVRHEE